MDNKVAIEVALANINSTSQILSDNPSFDVINSNLNAIKLILESQLGEDHFQSRRHHLRYYLPLF